MSAVVRQFPGKAQAERTYYGWTIVVLAALAMAGTLPGRTQGLGLITEPLLADLGISRVGYANINLWATLLGALFCVPCGRLVDRFGARAVLTVVTFALGATVLAMSSSRGFASLAIGVTLTRGFGQSALSVVSLALVGKWFGRRLNYAMGLYALLVSVFFIAAFPAVGGMVLSRGWRLSWAAVGFVLVFVLAPLFWMAVRNQPPDAEIEMPGEGDQESRGAGLSLAQALRGPAFWVLGGASALFGLAYSGISLFNQSILEQRGFDATVYHSVLVVSTMLGLAANFAGGWLGERWPIQKLMAVGMAVLAAALSALPLATTLTHVYLYAAAMGLAGGVVTVVFFSVWGKFYGAQHLGKIQGCAQMMTVIASAVGPLLLAETLSRTGSYDLLFRSLAAVVLLFAAACWLVKAPRSLPHEV